MTRTINTRHSPTHSINANTEKKSAHVFIRICFRCCCYSACAVVALVLIERAKKSETKTKEKSAHTKRKTQRKWVFMNCISKFSFCSLFLLLFLLFNCKMKTKRKRVAVRKWNVNLELKNVKVWALCRRCAVFFSFSVLIGKNESMYANSTWY